MSLVEHAERELRRVGEDPDVIAWYLRVVEAFASYGHSGASADITRHVLHDLLAYKPLGPLTDDPAEWLDVSGYVTDHSDAMWQNRRDSEAFSTDGGQTYYLLSERHAAGDLETTPLHRSEPAKATT